LNDFQYGGASITGFSLIDEDIQLLSSVLDRKETPKKLFSTPVCAVPREIQPYISDTWAKCGFI
jgi:hypothetical protein